MLNLLRNYNPKDAMTERFFPNAEGSTEQSKELQAMLTPGCWENIASLNLKKLSVFNPHFKLKSSLIIKYCQSTNFFIELGQGGHIKRLENSIKNAKFEQFHRTRFF